MRLVRLLCVTLAALAFATPASAQFGGLKKRVKKASGQDDKPAAAAPADPAGQGGTVVLTADVVNQLLTGLRAARAERKAAAKESTSYGRYQLRRGAAQV